MARVPIDEVLRRLRGIRDDGDLVNIRAAVVKHLDDHSNLVVAEAVKLIIDLELSGFVKELLATWDRLVNHSDPIKVDKGCTAKAAIIRALGQMDYDEPDFYLAAIKYQQKEPTWGKEEDTAEAVRAGAAFALARSQRLSIVDKLNAFVDYSFYESRSDCINAAKAIADTGHQSAVPVLRLMLLSGQGDAEARGACMNGLLSLAPASSISLVAKFLDHPVEDIVYEAAAALGICGRPKAVELLIAKFKTTEDKELRRSLLLSIGLSRDPSALTFLIAHLETGRDGEATLEALQPSCVYPDAQTRVRDVIDKLGDKKLKASFERKFGK